MSSGSLFQSSGAETENVLDPEVLRLRLTGFRLNVEDDWSDLEGKEGGDKVLNVGWRLLLQSFEGK